MPKPIYVVLKVDRIQRRQCDDIIYARSSDSKKSEIFEEIRISDPNVGRCNYIKAVHGELIYRINGVLKSELGSTVNHRHYETAVFKMK